MRSKTNWAFVGVFMFRSWFVFCVFFYHLGKGRRSVLNWSSFFAFSVCGADWSKYVPYTCRYGKWSRTYQSAKHLGFLGKCVEGRGGWFHAVGSLQTGRFASELVIVLVNRAHIWGFRHVTSRASCSPDATQQSTLASQEGHAQDKHGLNRPRAYEKSSLTTCRFDRSWCLPINPATQKPTRLVAEKEFNRRSALTASMYRYVAFCSYK